MARTNTNTRDQAINVLRDLLANLDAESVVVVLTQPGLLEETKTADWLLPELAGYDVRVVDGFTPNPDSAELESLRTDLADTSVALWIAVGGGSAIDIMKLLRLFTALPADIPVAEFLAGAIEPAFSPAPSIAIPTTAGTGSEATPFAVLYHQGVKHSLDFPQLLPDVAILLPESLASLPTFVRMPSALDALCQAIESYWNIHSTDKSKAIARQAIETILPVIVPFVTQPDNWKIDAAMQRGSMLAGQAIALTRTTGPHAVSYPMTSRFGLPHGLAVALTLGEFLYFNAHVTEDDCNDPRGAGYVQASLAEIRSILGCDTPSSARKFWRNLLNKLGVSCRLEDHGITSDEHINQIVAEGASPKRMNNNPRRINAKQLAKLLRHELSNT